VDEVKVELGTRPPIFAPDGVGVDQRCGYTSCMVTVAFSGDRKWDLRGPQRYGQMLTTSPIELRN
jgi:hypothetical protein